MPDASPAAPDPQPEPSASASATASATDSPPAPAGGKTAGTPSGGGRKNAAVVSLAIMASRVCGLIREQVFAAMFGAGKLLDAYYAAFQIPNLLRDLFAEGALSTAFTTTFTKLWEKEGEISAWELAQIVATFVVFVLGAIVLLGIALSGPLVHLLNPGYFLEDPSKYSLTVDLTRILFPFILFVSLAAVVMGVLNSRNFFALPASASTVFNVTSVICGVILAYVFDPQEDIFNPQFGVEAVYGVAVGVLIGGLAQLAIQLPLLWKLGFRFRWRLTFTDPRLRAVLALVLPSVLAVGAVQINNLVNYGFASYEDGARSYLTLAFRLFQFPIGVFGVAIATVTLPAVSRAHAREDMSDFGRTLENALRFAFFLTIPASAGLAVMAEPLVRIIYQHGAMTSADAAQTAFALQAYCVGIAGYAGIKVLVPCFYALNEPQIPVRISLFAIVLNLILACAFFWWLDMGHVGLALTVGLVAVLNFFQNLWFMVQRVSVGTVADWLSFTIKLTIATAVLCGLAWQGCLAIAPVEELYGLLAYIMAVLFVVGVAAAGYFITAYALGLKEISSAVNIVLRKLGRKK